jgi:hypothetical protein
MPTTREFIINMEDRPGTLGKFSRALANRGVNIVAFHATTNEGKGLVRLVTDNPASTRATLETERLSFTETDVAQVKLPHRPGELARAASRLGEAGFNINYAYSGVEPGSNAPLLIFGVADVGKAASILDQAATAAGR